MIASLSPSHTTAGLVGTTLTINGSNFTTDAVAKWSGKTSLATTFLSTSQLTAKVTTSEIQSPGTANITVSNSVGTSNGETFTINGAPTLTSISPTQIRASASGFTLTARGLHYDSTCTITWLGQVLPTTFVSNAELTATVAASLVATPGNATVRVVNGDGSTTPAQTFTVTKPPVLLSISPNNAANGGVAFTLTATGANFASDSQITWNGSALNTKFISATSLSATIGSSLIAQAGTVPVTVLDSDGSESAAQQFVVGAKATITSLSPASTTPNSKAFTLTVNGSSFVSGAVVSFSGTALTTTFVSAAQLTAAVTAAMVTTAGSYPVMVTLPSGAMSNSVNFKVSGSQVPTVTALSPATIRAGASQFTLTVTGTGYAQGDSVLWSGVALPAATFISSTQLTATVPAANVASPVNAPIVVETSGGVKSKSLMFAVTKSPAILSISPSAAEANTPGFLLTVTGANFAADSTITWNGAAQTTTFVSSTALTAQIPTSLFSSPGTVNIGVIDNDGSGAAPATFTITPDPSLTSLSPASAPANTPGLTLTVNGVNLSGGTIVSFGGAGVSTNFVSSTQLSAYVPAPLLTTAGTYSVSVTDPNNITSNSMSFVVNPGPVLTSISPNTVTAGAATFTLTLNGSGFRSGAQVMWNGASLATKFVSSSKVTAVISASLVATPGQPSVTVQNSDGSVTASLLFNIDVLLNGSTIWDKPLVWSHYLQHFPIDLTIPGQINVYNDIFPLGLTTTTVDNSPAIEIALAQTAGFDGFDVDIFTTAGGITDYLSAADNVPGFYIAPALDLSVLFGASAPDSQVISSIVQAVEGYVNIAATHPSAARDNNKLVIWNFDPDEYPLADWAAARAQIVADGYDNTTWVADVGWDISSGTTFLESTLLDDMGVFEAGYDWLGHKSTFWPQLVDLYQTQGRNFAGGTHGGKGVTNPTYDDEDGTEKFRDDWQKNISMPGQWNQISTWNAYPEQTGTNPTSDWSTVRSDINAWYSAIFKGKPAPFSDARLYVTSPRGMDLNQPEIGEALIINPTANPLTAKIQFFDGAGKSVGNAVTATIPADNIGVASFNLNFTTQPADGYVKAHAFMMDAAGNQLASEVGPPVIVYAAGQTTGALSTYYSVPANKIIPGTVTLALTPISGTSTATAKITTPGKITVNTVDLLYNTAELENFLNVPPYSTTVSTVGPGYYVARVIDTGGNVIYSNPVYVGP